VIDFKERYPDIPILVIIPVSNSAKIIADMTNQLLQFSEILGRDRVLLSFGIGESDEDDTYYQISKTSEALYSSNIEHRVQFIKDREDWTQRMLQAYMNDFEIAVILRGVICSTDLVSLVIHATENDADMACAVDISFSSSNLVTTASGILDRTTGSPIPIETLLRSTKFVQTGCCDGSVKVLSTKAVRAVGTIEGMCHRQNVCPEENTRGAQFNRGCEYSPKIMISPSVKASPDPDDFRSAIQLGFMDLQGFDYNPLIWTR
jgi:hypothetical protein